MPLPVGNGHRPDGHGNGHGSNGHGGSVPAEGERAAVPSGEGGKTLLGRDSQEDPGGEH